MKLGGRSGRRHLSQEGAAIVTAVLALLLIQFALLASRGEAREVLPPHAYFNRTIYPPLQNYSDRTPELSIGIISDVQYADEEEKQRRHYRLSLPKLKHAVSEMNANRSHLHLVLHLGDLTDNSMERYLPVLQPVLKKLAYPFYQVLGNHDFLGLPETKLDGVYKMLGMPARYYSINVGLNHRYRIVILDGNDLAFYSTAPKSEKRKDVEAVFNRLRQRRAKNAKGFNGAVGVQQMAWLEGQLSDACNSSQRVILIVHHPLLPKDDPTCLWNNIELITMINQYPCVIIVLSGHAHKWMYDSRENEFRTLHYVTFGGMVQSPFTSFGFADVYEEELHLHGLIFGRAISNHYDIRRKGHGQPSAEREALSHPPHARGELRKADFISPSPVVVSLGPSTDSASTSAGGENEGVSNALHFEDVSTWNAGWVVLTVVGVVVVFAPILRRLHRRHR